MYRLEMDKLLNKLSMLSPSKRRDHDTKKARVEIARCEASENELDSLLWETPGTANDSQMLVICREKVENHGEDSFVAVREGQHVLLGVFDGCGGSGGKICASFDGHTGAWVASRAAAVAAGEWFVSSRTNDAEEDAGLAACVDRALQACKSKEATNQVLLGSLSKEFPTTVAVFRKEIASDVAEFYWCGDSRCYVLDGGGLHQVTLDDTAVQDAMRNLREDAPMTNVASASLPFQIHQKRLEINAPSVIFAATDGCFGYLPSPMAFERLLLETMARSSSMEEWQRQLDAQIGRVSGDDYTLTAWPHRFTTFKEMKQAFHDRLAILNKDYLQVTLEEELLRQWEAYKTDYESMLTGDETCSERGLS